MQRYKRYCKTGLILIFLMLLIKIILKKMRHVRYFSVSLQINSNEPFKLKSYDYISLRQD